MSFNTTLTNELNLLSQFNLTNEQDGIKIHHDAASELKSAAEKLHDKGLITQVDGGYLTELGRKAAEHTQALSSILK
jgi:uncharacterized protein (TIGR02647 family)